MKIFMVLLMVGASFSFNYGCKGCKAEFAPEETEETLVFDKQIKRERSIVISVEDIPHTDLCKVFIEPNGIKIPLTVSKKTKPKVGDTVEVLCVLFRSEVYGQQKKLFTIKTE